MKIKFKISNTHLVLLICFNFLMVFKSFGQDLNIMTYNIRYSILTDSRDNWDARKVKMVELFKNYQPDVFGIQEGMIHQLEYIKNQLPNYNFVGVGRADGRSTGEFNAIFYNEAKFEIVEQNTFWLSETSNKVSKGWDAGYTRICTYALLEDKSSKNKFWVFNTHFDHQGPMAREKSAALILDTMKELNKEKFPAVLMGDLNDISESKAILILKGDLADALETTKHALYGPKGTFNGYDPNKIIDSRIDYIFVSNMEVLSYQHIDDRLDDNLFISDHLPVLIKATLIKGN